MKKLLLVNTYGNLWSTGRLAAEVGEVAKNNGWECYFAYASQAKPCGYQMIRINTSRVLNKIHFFFSRILNLKGFGSWWETRKFIRTIKKICPDIIHLHNIHGDYLNIPLFFRFLKRANIPVVWSLHDCWAMTGGCTHFVYFRCEQWKTGCHNCPRYKNKDRGGELRGFIRTMPWVYKYKKQLFEAVPNLTIVSASEWLAQIARNSYLSIKDIRVIPNGIDVSIFKPYDNTTEIRRKYDLRDKFVIMGVGTEWSVRKGFNDYLQLSQKLSSDFVIVLVGVDHLTQKQLPTNIIGISKTDNIAELALLYSTANVVTSLSYQEAFGLTPIEGFACGTPAIVYNNTALPELITPQTGIIVETGSIDKLVEAIEEIRSRGKQYYSPCCRETAEKFYNKYTQYSKYVELYQEILTKKMKS